MLTWSGQIWAEHGGECATAHGKQRSGWRGLFHNTEATGQFFHYKYEVTGD